MSDRNSPDDCCHGQFDWHPLSPDYNDVKERALDTYLEDPDRVAELITANAEELAVEFVCGNSISSKIVKIAIKKQGEK